MNYTEVRRLIEEVASRRLREERKQLKCLRCGKETTMVRVYVEDVESGEEFPEELVRWRCLNCLGLFSEELREVK